MRTNNGALKKHLLTVARIMFVGAALVFGVWSVASNGDAVTDAVDSVDVFQLVVSMALVILGLLFGAVSFALLMKDVGYPLPMRLGQMIFLVGSLGKYIPGSVWFLAAQADLARRVGVPPRRAVTVGLLVVYWALFTAVFAGSVAVAAGGMLTGVPLWVKAVILTLSVSALAPPVVTWWARRLSGDRALIKVSLRQTALLSAAFAGIWILNGSALALLLTNSTLMGFESLFVLSVGAFSLAFAIGLVVPLAPAGLGLREGALVFLLAPTAGLGSAVVAATVMRLLHLLGDFGLAGAYWWISRSSLSVTAKSKWTPHDGPTER